MRSEAVVISLTAPFLFTGNFVGWPQQIKFVISFISIIPVSPSVGSNPIVLIS
jgi:hypothetical protein